MNRMSTKSKFHTDRMSSMSESYTDRYSKSKFPLVYGIH